MPYFFLITLISLWLRTASQNVATGEKFELNPELSGFDFNKAVLRHETGVSSLFACLVICHVEFCGSFSYQEDKKSCIIYGARFCSSTNVTRGSSQLQYFMIDDNSDIGGCEAPSDCQDIQTYCSRFSGVYTIFPQGISAGVDVYCDMDTDGGGWTAFLIRKDGTEDFDRSWGEYKKGFGDPCGEYWLGNDIVHILSTQGQYELRVDLEDFDKNTRYAAYHTFAIGDEGSNYTLTVIGYTGTAGDGLAHHNGKQFSTYEFDNDVWEPVHCAGIYRAGFWYGKCHSSLPTGKYLWGENGQYARGVVWIPWKGYYYSLKTLTMKIRRKM